MSVSQVYLILCPSPFYQLHHIYSSPQFDLTLYFKVMSLFLIFSAPTLLDYLIWICEDQQIAGFTIIHMFNICCIKMGV